MAARVLPLLDDGLRSPREDEGSTPQSKGSRVSWAEAPTERLRPAHAKRPSFLGVLDAPARRPSLLGGRSPSKRSVDSLRHYQLGKVGKAENMWELERPKNAAERLLRKYMERNTENKKEAVSIASRLDVGEAARYAHVERPTTPYYGTDGETTQRRPPTTGSARRIVVEEPRRNDSSDSSSDEESVFNRRLSSNTYDKFAARRAQRFATARGRVKREVIRDEERKRVADSKVQAKNALRKMRSLELERQKAKELELLKSGPPKEKSLDERKDDLSQSLKGMVKTYEKCERRAKKRKDGKAAKRIQRTWRGYKARKETGDVCFKAIGRTRSGLEVPPLNTSGRSATKTRARACSASVAWRAFSARTASFDRRCLKRRSAWARSTRWARARRRSSSAKARAPRRLLSRSRRAVAAGLASMLRGGGGSDGGLGEGDFTCLRNNPLRVRSGVALMLSLNLAGSGENGLRGVGSPSTCSARHARAANTDQCWRSVDRRAYVVETTLDRAVAKRWIAAAEAHGWTTMRHHRHPTRDVPVSLLDVGAAVFEFLERDVISAVAGVYGLDAKRLSLNDCFLVKYETGEGLGTHKDGSEYSFSLPLNDGFTGGGTFFEDLGSSVRPRVGEALVHPGDLRHGGAPVSQGVRYVLVGFLKYK